MKNSASEWVSEDVRKVWTQLYNMEYLKQRIQAEIIYIRPEVLINVNNNVNRL
jgi:hypothetical protein